MLDSLSSLLAYTMIVVLLVVFVATMNDDNTYL